MAETPVDPGSLAAGTELGRYTVLGFIGRGATFEAHAAKITGAQGFEKAVALKVPGAGVQADAALRDDFVRRAKRAFSLSHANILGAIDLGRAELADGRTITFLVTERARGTSLSDLHARAQAAGVTLPVAAVFRLAAEVAKALDHAHRRKEPIAHGALSERKLFLSAEGQLKVGDFGLSAEGEHATPAADLAALAALVTRLAGDALPESAAAILADLAHGDAGSAHDRLLELSFALSSDREDRSLARLYAAAEKGRHAPETSLLAEAEIDAALSQSASALGGQGRFVGRAEELARIASALVATRQEGSRRGWLVGPSGAGKTRLLREMARRMPADAGRVVVVASTATLARVPFGAAVVATRALASLAASGRLDREDVTRSLRAFGCDDTEIAALATMMGVAVDPDASRAPLHEALLTLVAGAGVPVLLAIDDARSIDPGSAALLEAITTSERAKEIPLLVVLVGREAEEPLLSLAELDDDAVAQLLASRLGARVIPPELFELVSTRAGGNPLFIETIVKELTEAALVSVERGVAELSPSAVLPPATSLTEVAQAKLATLPPLEQRALALMTVSDGGASTDLLAAALD
ncbi:MAG: AAA family ATPase, partial [Myxococcales bacterium]|nr:AAA family ATPase [Myxococcales bacterium]